MKKVTVLIILAALIFTCAGCKRSEPDFTEAANFYYPVREIAYGTDSGAIKAEQKEVSHIHQDAAAFLSMYLIGPSTPDLYSPFPTGISVLEIGEQEGTIAITFSSSITHMNGIELTIALSCLSMSLFEYTDAVAVEIKAEEGMLDDRESITITRDNLLLFDAPPAATEPA